MEMLNHVEKTRKDRFGKLNLVGFFILGIFGVLTSILAAVWIFFKTKVKKKQKYIAVITGLIVSVVITFSIQQFFFYKAPETKEMQVAVKSALSSGRTTIGYLGIHTTVTSEGSFVSKSVDIHHLTGNLISA